MASVINQIKLGTTEYAIAASAYAECSTAAGTAAKVATICTDSDTTNTAFTLIKGVSVQVKFNYGDTTPAGTIPTLNINGTGAKTILYRNDAIDGKNILKNNGVYTFVYNGSEWELVGEIDKNSVSGNAGTATKLQTARTIGLGTGATGTATSFDGSTNITIPVTEVKEAYLSWGGKNHKAAYGPIDAAMIPDLGANRFAFFPKDLVDLEFSTDGGASWWMAPGSTGQDEIKKRLFSTGATVYIGQSSSTGINKTNYMCRVTVTTSGACYSILNKFAIYVSTGGSTGSYCTIEGRTQADLVASRNTWVNFANKVPIEGWSGWNIINTNNITTHGNDASQYCQLRFTFGVASHAASVAYPGLSIQKIMAFGGVGWTTPSNMAKHGAIYNYDADQNVSFPANVTATNFNGPLSGNASSATKVNNNLTVKLNGGTTEGTNLFTFDGSAAKTLNITAAAVGAASTTHTHGNIASGGTLSNAGRVVITDTNKKVTTSSVTATELGYLTGVTDDIQSQLDIRAVVNQDRYINNCDGILNTEQGGAPLYLGSNNGWVKLDSCTTDGTSMSSIHLDDNNINIKTTNKGLVKVNDSKVMTLAMLSYSPATGVLTIDTTV